MEHPHHEGPPPPEPSRRHPPRAPSADPLPIPEAAGHTRSRPSGVQDVLASHQRAVDARIEEGLREIRLAVSEAVGRTVGEPPPPAWTSRTSGRRSTMSSGADHSHGGAVPGAQPSAPTDRGRPPIGGQAGGGGRRGSTWRACAGASPRCPPHTSRSSPGSSSCSDRPPSGSPLCSGRRPGPRSGTRGGRAAPAQLQRVMVERLAELQRQTTERALGGPSDDRRISTEQRADRAALRAERRRWPSDSPSCSGETAERALRTPSAREMVAALRVAAADGRAGLRGAAEVAELPSVEQGEMIERLSTEQRETAERLATEQRETVERLSEVQREMVERLSAEQRTATERSRSSSGRWPRSWSSNSERPSSRWAPASAEASRRSPSGCAKTSRRGRTRCSSATSTVSQRSFGGTRTARPKRSWPKRS